MERNALGAASERQKRRARLALGNVGARAMEDRKRPIVMFGDTRSRSNIALLADRRWGRMFATTRPTPFPFEQWGFDNGAFKAWQDAGFPRDLTLDDWAILFDVKEFDRRLTEAMKVTSDPLLAVTPDIPASKYSLEYSLSWISEFNGWPWYLAVQDGMREQEVEEVIHLFMGIFLGGSDSFKMTAYRWAKLAHKHCKKFHYGRAGTPGKVKHAFAVGADSLDSTFACWTKQRTAEFCKVWDGLGSQQELWP